MIVNLSLVVRSMCCLNQLFEGKQNVRRLLINDLDNQRYLGKCFVLDRSPGVFIPNKKTFLVFHQTRIRLGQLGA
jgi:hypothetical protein